MNLFVLDRRPETAAQYHCDKHVRKMILEAVEMMGYVYPHGQFQPWPWVHSKGRHYNHPMSKWVRASRHNFDWTLQYAEALCHEFVWRFDKKVRHACHAHVDWIASHIPFDQLLDMPMTDWPRCFGPHKEQIVLSSDAVFDYRTYYMVAKRHMAVWTKRGEPFWWK